MTQESDNLQSRVDAAFEEAVNQQLAEQREIRRLVGRVDESVSSLSGGFAELTNTVDRDGDMLRRDVNNHLTELKEDLDQTISALNIAVNKSSSALDTAVERLYVVAAEARDTNGTVLGQAVDSMRDLLNEGYKETRNAIDRLGENVGNYEGELQNEVKNAINTIRAAIENQSEVDSTKLANTVVDIRETLETVSKRDEQLLRQAIGAIENRLDYGRTQTVEQLEVAHQALSDELARERSNREELIDRLNRSLTRLDADRDARKEEFNRFAEKVSQRLEEAVKDTGQQWKNAVSALQRATDGLHDDRDQGRQELANSLAALTGITDTSTRRIDQLNMMIDTLQSSTDGIAPIIEEVAVSIQNALAEQLAQQRTHASSVVERIERGQIATIKSTSETVEQVIEQFEEQVSRRINDDQERASVAITALRTAIEELRQANGGFVEDWDERTTNTQQELQKTVSYIAELAEGVSDRISVEVRRIASELGASQKLANDTTSEARTALNETQRALASQLKEFEPAVQASLDTIVKKVEQTLDSVDSDIAKNALAVSAQMRDSSADLRQQLDGLADVAREEVRRLGEQATEVSQADRDRLERTMSELNDASTTVRSTMEHLVSGARHEMSVMRTESLATLDEAVRSLESLSEVIPLRVQEAAKSYESALEVSSNRLNSLANNVDTVMAGRLERLENTALDINEAQERVKDVILDQVSRLRAAVETTSQQLAQDNEATAGIYRRELADSVENIERELEKRVEQVTSHLAARVTDIQEANTRGATQIQNSADQVVNALESFRPLVDNAVNSLSDTLVSTAAQERARSDENLDRLTGAVDLRMANLNKALTDLAERLSSMTEDARLANAAVVADFSQRLLETRDQVSVAMRTSSEALVQQTGELLDEQLQSGLAELVKALNETKNLSATHNSATQQAMTEAESAYRNATARLEEVVDASRREIEAAITQVGEQLERRSGALGNGIREEISVSVSEALQKAGEQFTHQVEQMSAREESGATRLQSAASSLSNQVLALESRVEKALVRLHEEHPDPAPELLKRIEGLTSTQTAWQNKQLEQSTKQFESLDQKLSDVLARVETDLHEQVSGMVVSIEDSVSKRVEGMIGEFEERIAARIEEAIVKRDQEANRTQVEIESVGDSVVELVEERISEIRVEAASNMRRMADQNQTTTQVMSDRINQTSNDLERRITEIQGAQTQRLEAIASELKSITNADRDEERRRVEELVNVIGRHVGELSNAVSLVEGLDDRVASRVSRSLTDLRYSLVEEVKSVGRELEQNPVRPSGFPSSSPSSTPSSVVPLSRPTLASSRSTPKLSLNRPAPPDRREQAPVNTTCPDCGFVARTSPGLATHRRTCPKR